MLIRFLHICLLSASLIPNLAAELAKEPVVSLNKAYWLGYVKDATYLATAPARWRLKEWIITASVIGGTVGLYVMDEDIHSAVQDRRNNATDLLAQRVKPVGDGLVTIPAMAIFGITSYYFGHDRGVTAALLSLESFLFTGAAVQSLKHLCHRHRPSSHDGPEVWDGPGLYNSELSFPSGHASSAFAVASIVAILYKEKGWVPWSAYSVAGLVALSRVHDNRHWPSDVFWGSWIGYAVARGIINSRLKTQNDKASMQPVLKNGCYGLAFDIKIE